MRGGRGGASENDFDETLCNQKEPIAAQEVSDGGSNGDRNENDPVVLGVVFDNVESDEAQAVGEPKNAAEQECQPHHQPIHCIQWRPRCLCRGHEPSCIHERSRDFGQDDGWREAHKLPIVRSQRKWNDSCQMMHQHRHIGMFLPAEMEKRQGERSKKVSACNNRRNSSDNLKFCRQMEKYKYRRMS